MSYKISSKKFDHPLLKPILEKLTNYFSKKDISFYVIGATARDIIMELNNEKSGRKTHDLDIAIAVSNWDQYKSIEKDIVKIKGFTKDTTQKQRFYYDEVFHLDIVPYGEIMKQDDKIFWPPDESIAMSVLGFNEVNKATKEILIDDSLRVDVASLEGIFLLKLVAFNDRSSSGNKDADDMAFIINNYLSINEDRALEKHYDVYEDDNFDTRSAGSLLLGKDLATLIGNSDDTKKKISSILNEQIELKERSTLVNQILETHKSFNYEIVLKCLKNIVIGINES